MSLNFSGTEFQKELMQDTNAFLLRVDEKTGPFLKHDEIRIVPISVRLSSGDAQFGGAVENLSCLNDNYLKPKNFKEGLDGRTVIFHPCGLDHALLCSIDVVDRGSEGCNFRLWNLANKKRIPADGNITGLVVSYTRPVDLVNDSSEE